MDTPITITLNRGQLDTLMNYILPTAFFSVQRSILELETENPRLSNFKETYQPIIQEINVIENEISLQLQEQGLILRRSDRFFLKINKK